jgi:hypothetical protein
MQRLFASIPGFGLAALLAGPAFGAQATQPADAGREELPLRWWESPVQPGFVQAAERDGGRPASDERLGSDAAFLEAVLTSPASSQAVRRGAAERLVRDRSPEATQAIERALRSKTAPLVTAAVEALDRAEARVPSLAEALVAVIASDLDVDRAAAARVLGQSDTRAVELLDAAIRGSRSNAARLGGIVALGELRSREAAARLVALFDERGLPAEATSAICAALERATGAGRGDDPAAWKEWWSDSSLAVVEVDRRLADEQQLRVRLDAAERTAADERRRAEQLAGRLVDVYEQLFLYLTRRERIERSVALLSDPLVEVRGFGIGQIERMLRNGERADEATRRAVTVLLDDPVPALRLRGVRLLDDLGATDLSARIVERLPRERDVEVARGYLAVLAGRPAAEVFAAVAPLVRDPALGEAAAAVLNRLADRKMMPPDAAAQLLPVLREIVATRPTGSAAQLLGWAGDDADLQRLTALLDAANADLRRGAAEGLRRRGIRRPIYERASDPAMYGPLLAALGEEPAGLATLEQFAKAVPPADAVGDWNAAVARVVREMPLADLLAADRLLEPLRHAELRTRLAGLARFTTAQRAGLPRSDLDAGLRRFVDASIAAERAADAIAVLGELDPKPGDAALDALFRAHALTGNFREAARLAPNASAWIALLESVVADAARARPIADEIALRFAADAPSSLLTQQEREQFALLRRSLPQSAPPTAANGTTTGASTGATAGGSDADR